MDFAVKKLLVSLFLLCSCLAELHGKYDITAFTLKNGLRAICVKKNTLPIVSFSIWYDCGSCCDALSRSGVAHFLEHMAFSIDKGAFDKFLETIGAEKNAFTSMKTICFYEIIPTKDLETIIESEAKRMKTIEIEDKKFINEKSVILEERSSRIDTNPAGQEQEVVLAQLLNRSPGSISIIGWKHEIESITPKDLLDFHYKWFAPNNATIIAVGDVDPTQLKVSLEKHFGNIERKKIPPQDDVGEKPTIVKETNFSSPKNGSFASVDYFYFVPFSAKSDFRKCIALKLAVQILNQPNFFVKKTLEDAMSKASSINFSYISGYLHYDILNITISCKSINDCVDSEKIWTHYLKKKILNVKLKQSDLDTIKQCKAIATAYQKDDITKIMNHIGFMLASRFNLEQVQTLDETLQSITLNECQEVLKEVLGAADLIAISRVTPKRYNRD